MLTKTDLAAGEVAQYTWDYRNRLTRVVVKDAPPANAPPTLSAPANAVDKKQ